MVDIESECGNFFVGERVRISNNPTREGWTTSGSMEWTKGKKGTIVQIGLFSMLVDLGREDWWYVPEDVEKI
jgi:hypothetical protein